ncbi:AMP-dependent synthetase/ligase [Mobilicoccus caccae]|uniref:AMP-dependent synthetase n=1 Tax=Mobilicoccus caccae TaxID=1859295 RepID=A0ABQ6IRW9_9MICO|nr:long-chain fatty acid--CoA ligase [Mobilicoccus caccae]GMA40095.1 AMP-dependent synthetase [Mobilicoccus caccae]
MTVKNVKDEPVERSVIDDRPPSCGHLLRNRVQKSADSEAYQYFRGEELERRTWRQTWDEVSAWAAGLVDFGIEVGDRVAILSSTRIEWVWANWGIMLAGAATTTVYATSNAEAVSYIVGHSGSRIVFAEDASQVEKLRVRRHEMPDVIAVVVFDPAEVTDLDSDDWVHTLDSLVERGRARLDAEPGLVDARVDSLTPQSLSTIIYTSGTTGNPKGAELTHDALVYEGVAVTGIDILSEDDLQYLWLPLAHVFGNVLIMIAVATGSPTCVDGRIDRIVPNLAVVRPTWMGAAPRIFEKAYAAVNATLGEATGAKAKLVSWAFGVGQKVAEAAEKDVPVGPALSAQHAIADKLVFAKIRERFGGRVRFFISGSARLDPELSWWFAGVGMQILEGYGLTETSAATCVNRPWRGAHQHGSIGWPLPGTETKLASDGELLVKGPGVMSRYHQAPEATAEAFTEDGFFRTGDVAEIDDNGFVRITDRKKDVFKTSGGKYIAPATIESRFKGLCPYVGQFIVVGNQRNYAAALVTLDPEAIHAWAAENGHAGQEYPELVRSEPVRALVQRYVDELNEGLNRWETIKRFTILDHDLTVDSGDLTPSLKLRRRAVVDKFSDEIDGLYQG